MSLQYNFFDGSQETLTYTYRFWRSSFPLFQHKTAISSRIKMGENIKTARNFDPVQDKQLVYSSKGSTWFVTVPCFKNKVHRF